MPAPEEVSTATREATAEAAAAAARGKAEPGEEVPRQAGAAVATGGADVAGPEAARGPLRRQIQQRSLAMPGLCFSFFFLFFVC